MNYLITGVTGVVGSHILFELLNDKLDKNHDIEKIYVIVRRKEKISAKNRVSAILTHKDSPNYIKKHNLEKLLNCIEVLEVDLLDHENIQKKLPSEKLLIIHAAGSTNLSSDLKACLEVENNNLKATQNLISSLQNTLSTFVYISTAFSEGFINDNQERVFRNPYEKAKYDTENTVIHICEKNNINWKILRPSIVCGRVIDSPLYFTPKFDVFYGWAKFFYTFKNQITTQFRIFVDEKSSLNIIPVDVLAKKIVFYSSNYQTKIQNLINNTSIPIENQIKSVMNSLNITNYSIVNTLPEKLNKIEEIYYSTIGKIFEPYISKPITFINEKYDLKINYNLESEMNSLIKYAINKKFKESY